MFWEGEALFCVLRGLYPRAPDLITAGVQPQQNRSDPPTLPMAQPELRPPESDIVWEGEALRYARVIDLPNLPMAFQHSYYSSIRQIKSQSNLAKVYSATVSNHIFCVLRGLYPRTPDPITAGVQPQQNRNEALQS